MSATSDVAGVAGVSRDTEIPRPSAGGPSGPVGGDEGGGGGGGGDEGGGGGDEWPISSAKLGMVFTLASLSVLFVVTAVMALILRRQATTWNPGVVPAFPPVLWANTVILLASSASLRGSVRAIARDDARGLRRGLSATTALGLLFLLGQVFAWRDLEAKGVTMGSGAFGTVFYWLTGLHAAHVLGGVASLGACTVGSLRGAYTAAAHLPVELAEIYWHFLGAVWIVLVALLGALL